MSEGRRHIGRGRLRGLLATSSVAALLVGGGAPSAFSQTFDINASPGNVVIPNSTFTAVRVAAPNVSVGGSVINTGTVNATATGILINNNATLVGGLTNNGLVDLSSKNGIVVNGATVFGGVLNSGTISNGNTGAGITVTNVSTFGGGITNGDTISVGGNGIFVGPTTSGGPVSTFSGGITNSGTISAGVTGIGVQTVQSFMGDISNVGTLSANAGIVVNEHVSQFAGNIVNLGAITAVSAIVVGCSCGVSTFAGSISNNGTITAALVGIVVTNVGTFGTSAVGGITNSGTITAGVGGIVVTNVHTFGTSAAGGITNSGEIFVAATSGRGIIVAGVSNFTGPIVNSGLVNATGAGAAGIEVLQVRSFTGTIVNGTSGTIAASAPGGVGIVVQGVQTFTGGITNAGLITAAGTYGILVTDIVRTFAGNISNSGTISAAFVGIDVLSGATFQGDITNSGTIAAGFIGMGASFVTHFNGDLVNSGKITAGTAGMEVDNIGTFIGSIINSGTGTIAATGAGISVSDSHTFIGDVSNNGLIAAGTGIIVGCSCGITNFTGNIVNNGTINATRTGIVVDNIVTFTGGITNTGTVSGVTGISISSTPSVKIFDSGTIIGSGGTAILFDSGTNTLTLGPGFNIRGNVIGVGNDTLQLGGTGNGAFNLSNIGTQYTGFTTFNVISANWVATGTGTQNWSIFNGATLQLGDGIVGDGGAITGNVVDNGTFAIDRADTYTFGGVISGSGSLVQMGPGTTVLTGTNNYSGGTTIVAGTLQVANNSAVGTGAVTLDGGIFQAGAGSLAFANAFVIDTGTGTIDTRANTLTLSGSISDGTGSTGGLTKLGSGTLILSGTSSYIGATNVNAGTLQAGAANALAPSSDFIVAGGATLSLAGFGETIRSLDGAGSIALGSGALTLSNASGTFGGTISGNGGSLIQSAGTETLTGTNSYAGGTVLNGGTLVVGNSSALGTGTLSMAAGTTLSFLGANYTLANNIAITGDPFFTPPVSTTQTLSGTISDGAVPGTLDMTGAGTLILTGTNKYSGATVIGSGTLALAGAGSIASSSGVTDNAKFDISGLTNGGASIASLSGGGAVALGGNPLTLTNANSTFGGAIGGTGGLTLTAGVETLTGTNSYTGATTIGSGTLALSGTGAIAQSSVVIDNGTFNIAGLTGGSTTITSLSGNGTVTLGVNTLVLTSPAGVFSGAIGGSGGLSLQSGTEVLSGNNSYSGATVINAGTLALAGAASIASSSGVADNGKFDISGLTNGGASIANLSGGGAVVLGGNTLTLTNSSGTFGGVIGGTGGFALAAGTETLTGVNSYTGATTISAGTLALAGTGGVGPSSVIVDTGTFSIAGLTDGTASVRSLSGGGTVVLGANTLFLTNPADTFSGTITGTGGVTVGPGTETLTGINSFTGTTNITSGTLALAGNGGIGASSAVTDDGKFDISGLSNGGTSIQSLSGFGAVILGANTLTMSNANGIFAGAITGSGGLTLLSGNEVLAGTNTYTGATNIFGTLEVDGAITSSSSVNVNRGGTLTGVGTVDPNTVVIASGGALVPGTPGVPGTSMTIAGNLALQSGALYVVYLNQTASTFANVTGTAALGGLVSAVVAPGTNAARQFTILQSAGLNGTTFAGLTTNNVQPNYFETLSYSANAVVLNLGAALGQGTPLNQNQQNTAAAINAFFNNGGTLSAGFANLFGLTGSGLTRALTQVDGENATGAAHSAFTLTSDFLGLMLDPFVYGRGGAASGGGPLGFAPDQGANFPSDVTLAYAGLLKAPPKQTFDQRWTVWGASFGGSGTANGNPAIGSNDVTASTYGFAAGADYHLSADTVLGFAAAGSGTNWSLAQSLGTGRSDAFQAGVYGTRYFGPAYVSAAVALTNNWFTTNRIATAGDQLTASFSGQSVGARVEGGYRYAVAPAMGLTPYAAIQAQSFYTPTYSETDLTGGGFGLTYNAMTATDTRSELGARFDALTAWGAMPVQLRARLAWAHDWVSNAALDAAFQGLPGSSFVVNGAAVPPNSALTSLGAELHLTPRWTLLGKFDGEFASSARTYAGSGTLRYQW